MRNLLPALDFKLSELLRIDLALGIAGAAGGLVLALRAPERVSGILPMSQGLVGVVLGAVVAGVSIQVAFFDASFLRKLRAIHRDPIQYLAPFLFTVVLGVVAMLWLLVVAALTPTGPVFVTMVTIGSLMTVWTIASLLPGLDTLVQFVGLKMDALDVPDTPDISDAASRRQGHSS